jgi:DNA-binding IscR family transcriptional regulator
MSAVDEGTRMTRCFGEAAGPCLGDTRCITHNLWSALGERIESFLASVSLRDVVDGLPPLSAGGRSPQVQRQITTMTDSAP